MDDLQKGRMLVFLQFGLIIILAVYPDSTNVDSRLNIFGIALITVGLISLFAGFRGLGKSLNANPVPNQDGVLVTTGIYGVVRHPIYLGLLIITLGLVVSSGVWGQALAWLALAILLTYKMRWEELLLTAKYKGYAEYAKRVPAIIPGLKPRKKK